MSKFSGYLFGTLFLLLLLAGCSNEHKPVRYDGRVEARQIRVSAQTPGVIEKLLVDEGELVNKMQPLVGVNSERLQAQYEQIIADLRFAQATLRKYQQLLRDGAISRQQYDELSARVEVLSAQVKNIKIQLKDTAIVAPQNGTILTIYARPGEYVQPGSPILELADLNIMEVRIYVPLKKLAELKIGQTVSVKVDGLSQTLSGKISWIAAEAEFTPKTILTAETRTTLVYAVKVKIANTQGVLKIGMPVEVGW